MPRRRMNHRFNGAAKPPFTPGGAIGTGLLKHRPGDSNGGPVVCWAMALPGLSLFFIMRRYEMVVSCRFPDRLPTSPRNIKCLRAFLSGWNHWVMFVLVGDGGS